MATEDYLFIQPWFHPDETWGGFQLGGSNPTLAGGEVSHLFSLAATRSVNSGLPWFVPVVNESDVRRTIQLYLGDGVLSAPWLPVLTRAFAGLSYAEIERELKRGQRQAVIQREPLEERLKALVAERARTLKRGERTELALDLVGTDFQLKTWRELHTIPYGHTRTYGQIAKENAIAKTLLTKYGVQKAP